MDLMKAMKKISSLRKKVSTQRKIMDEYKKEIIALKNENRTYKETKEEV